MPTAVVTGGAGFLGSHLCDHLIARGFRVISVDNLDTGSLQNVEHLRSDSFLFLNHDLTGHLEIEQPIDFLVGLQDDAMVLRGNPTFTFGTMKQLRVQIVRINLNWPDVAERRPAHPQDPADPAYDWRLYDRAIRYAGQNGMQVMLTFLFVPRWANGGKPRNVPPTNDNDLRNFAYAAATRYSGRYIPNTDAFDEVFLPAVKYWLAWNEPSNPNWLQQVSGGRFVSPRSYARICTAIWQGVHFTNFAGEKVGCGVTGPRGNNQARSSRPSMSPLAFMRATRRAGLRNLDAYAHNPYYGRPSETPKSRPGGTAITLGNINTLISVVNKLWGKKRIWITEYGWQTRPPDSLFGVSFARQAAYVRQSFAIGRRNPRIDMIVWFMLRDDTNLSIGWQSGFLTATGRKKPAFSVFARLPHQSPPVAPRVSCGAGEASWLHRDRVHFGLVHRVTSLSETFDPSATLLAHTSQRSSRTTGSPRRFSSNRSRARLSIVTTTTE